MEPIRKGLFSRKWIVAFLVYIGLIAICCIAVYAVPSVKGILERTYIAEYGKVDVKDEVTGFIVRDEVVYVAKNAGKINRLAEENTLVKAGARVIELKSEENAEAEAEAEAKAMTEAEAAESEKTSKDDKTKDDKSKDEIGAKDDAKAEDNGKSKDDAKAEDGEKTEGGEEPEETVESIEDATNPGRYTRIMEDIESVAVLTDSGVTNDAGYVSYYVDGAEARLSTDAYDGLSKKELKSLSGKRSIQTPEHHCGKGYPVFKIVKNKKWYLVYYLSNEDAAKYTEGGTVEIDINGEPVTVSVHRIDSGTKTSKITLTCKTFFDGFFEERSMDTKVTVSSAQGLVLEDASIVEAPDGKRGVFVKNKLGEHVFTPVSVKADDGIKCVVYSDIYVDAEGNFVETIGTYDEIVASPSEDDIASLKKAGSSDKESKSKN